MEPLSLKLSRLTLSKPSMRAMLRRYSPVTACYQVPSVAPAKGSIYTSFFKKPIEVIMIGCIAACTVSACEPAETEISDEQNSKYEGISDQRISHGHKHSSDSSSSLQHKSFPETKFTPKIVQPVQVNISASTAASRIVESLELNQAKLAAKSNDKCPKLIVPKVDSNEIVRKGEVMKSDHCDYYLYPLQGQKLQVSSYPDTTQATLIAPIDYDFNNGSYRANSADKHTIRIAYTGSERFFDPLNYDVVVTVE